VAERANAARSPANPIYSRRPGAKHPGAFPARVNPDLAAVALAGAVMYRRLMTPTPMNPSDAEALVATVLGEGPSRRRG